MLTADTDRARLVHQPRADPSVAENDATSLVRRAFVVLACFSTSDRELSLAQLVARTGLPKATLHRLAGQLIAAGALERSGRNYRLGVKMFELSGAVWAQRVLRDIAMPFLQELYEQTRETVQLAMFDGDAVLYIDRIRGHNTAVLPTFPGGRMPAYCTALGKAMLAFSPAETVNGIIARGLIPLSPRTVTTPNLLIAQLRSIQRTRIAYDAEESVSGVCCVAAPVLGANGRAIAAVSVSATTPRARRLRAESVRSCATRIGQALRDHSPGA
ncbi:MAG: IclR family transcriptional regulator [Modestobacter sp.]|nr:IclR family transcriptional regulator [Modestobacter sp.]